MRAGETIFAFGTGAGVSAISVLRISGSRCNEILEKIVRQSLKSRHAAYTGLFDPQSGELLDRGIVVFFPGPRSFTGEDCLEFHCHGSSAVKAAIVKALNCIPDCRQALAGEFTKRAFLNKKMDISAAEGLADLLVAKTESQRKQALGLVEGKLQKLSFEWRNRILSLLSLVEACVDFSDEGDTPDDVLADVEFGVIELVQELEGSLENFRFGQVVRDGFRVALCGPPNSGKSTLLNWLSHREVALVSGEAGTTRDVIEVDLNIGGMLVTCVDGAGIRHTDVEIEKRGIQKMREIAASCDLVIWLSPILDHCSVDPEILDQSSDLLEITSKVDLSSELPVNQHTISVTAGIGLESLLSEIQRRAVGMSRESSLISNERHRYVVDQVLGNLRRASKEISGSSLEFLAEELRLAGSRIGELGGVVGPEEVLGEIFSRFCIGK